MELIDNLRLSFLYWIDCTFKSTKKLNHDIRDSVDKPIVPGHCMFTRANPHNAPIVDCVPISNLLWCPKILTLVDEMYIF